MKEEKKHRHKWEQVFYDCGFCGGGEAYECECGEVKNRSVTTQKKKK